MLAIGTLLFCLAAPALSNMRLASTRTACINNMRQLGLAAANHEAVTKRFPLVSMAQGPLTSVAPGTVADKPELSSGYGLHTMLLPYMEERILYDDMRESSERFAKPPFDPAVKRRDDVHFAAMKIPALVCPTVKQATVTPNFPAEVDGRRANVTTEYAALGERGIRPAISSYVGIVGTHYDAKEGLLENGVVVSRCWEKDGDGNCIGKGLKLKNIADGISKTVLMCESRETAYAAWIDGQSAWVVGLDATKEISREDDRSRFLTAEASLLNAGPDPDKMQLAPTYSDLGLDGSKAWPGKAPRRWGPSSTHSNGAVMHCFADIHVVALSDEVDPTVYARMITRADGDPVGDIKNAPAGEKLPAARVPMELRATIDKAIALIEKKDFEALIRTLADPDDLKRITERQSVEEIAKQFASRKADQQLLKALQATKEKNVEVRKDGEAFIFKMKRGTVPRDEIRFTKIDGRWYIGN